LYVSMSAAALTARPVGAFVSGGGGKQLCKWSKTRCMHVCECTCLCAQVSASPARLVGAFGGGSGEG